MRKFQNMSNTYKRKQNYGEYPTKFSTGSASPVLPTPDAHRWRIQGGGGI